MDIVAWLRPPRHLLVLLSGITLVLVTALGWLGWRLFQQERALERQRVQERLERAGDRAATGLRQRLAEVEQRLGHLSTIPRTEVGPAAATYAAELMEDALVVVLTREGVTAYPAGRLLYVPSTPASEPAPHPAFLDGEILEHRERDYARARGAYAALARSADPQVRAGALVRLARTERKLGNVAGALRAYDDLAPLGAVPVEGVPSELVARFARIGLQEPREHPDSLRLWAHGLWADLVSGRWQLTRGAFLFHYQELRRWVDADTVAPMRFALADGVGELWRERRAAGPARQIVWVGQQALLLVRASTGDRITGLVAAPSQLLAWLADTSTSLAPQDVRFAIADLEGRQLLSRPAVTPAMQARRGPLDMGLPVTLQVTSADPEGEFAQLVERRRLLFVGMLLVASLALLGLYGVTRGVTRELEAARLQSDFVAAVSHEFRTPLTSLRQLAELLSSGRVTGEERRADYYTAMHREAERLQRLVEGLLDFGRMEAGALEFRFTDVAVAEVVREVVDEFGHEASSAGYTIELDGDADQGVIHADREALKRAVWNLLDNAVKYSPDCKTVWVEHRRDDGRVAIRVRDRGIGVPAAERETIFRKFVRGSTTRGDLAAGTGIGLAMVRHIAEAHGGTVRVESEIGVGSTFSILLPTTG